ncbi:MAG: DUF2207 domain-containing protein [Candidatus Saccharibacteria bacterium]
MKRMGIVLLVAATMIGAVFLPTTTAQADVNDFHFSNFEADYYLSKDSSGRSNLKVIEKLTAEFPTFDQNKGIERAIPSKYDGHTVSFHLESLLRNGQPEPIFSQSNENGNVVVATGDDNYVHGSQTYQLTYTLRDVTKFFADTNDDEFYWDTNGTQWQQRFDHVTARIHIADSIKDSLNDKTACYEGTEGSTSTCQLSGVDGIYVASQSNIAGGENVTVVVGFAPHTFETYKQSASDVILKVLFYALVAVQLLMLPVVMIFKRSKRARGSVGRGTIVPEYLPPKNVNVLVSSVVDTRTKAAMTAEYLSLAVRHKIKIIESKKKQFFGSKTIYTFEVVSTEGLDEDETQVMSVLFGTAAPEVGAQYEITKVNPALGATLQVLAQKIRKRAEHDGYFVGALSLRMKFYVPIGIIMAMSFVAFLVGNSQSQTPPMISGGIGIFLGWWAMAMIATVRPFTDKGIELYEYLQGLKMYIKLAETDRLKVLQSPEGAEKTPIDTSDGMQVVHLYERVLPFAVLFGEEKEWLKQLGAYYDKQQSQPGWYSGTSAFNAATFASSVSSFSSYSASSSSSSGGSSGGGSSGGGGGGGGGGGR